VNKVHTNVMDAITDITDGSSVMMQSFIGPLGVAQTLIENLTKLGSKDLTLIVTANISHAGGYTIHPQFKPFIAPRILIEAERVRKVILGWGVGAQFPGEERSPWIGREEKLDYEYLPIGVMAHRIRAAGTGMGAFYSPVGPGTWFAKGKEVRVINGQEYLLEFPLGADFGFVRASKADKLGNLYYRLSERMYSPLIAKACKTTIAEVDEIVEPGEIAPDQIITPGIYIDRIVLTDRKVVPQ
jgi:3-oxoadipate CoA-transferase, alpha subunit